MVISKTTKMVVLLAVYHQNGIMSNRVDKILKLGERLKELRQERGLSQRELAAVFGLNSVTYLHYEKEQRQPPLELLFKFASYFDVTIDYLLGYSDF